MHTPNDDRPASPVADRQQALDRIFRPRGVAIVGASADPQKRGYQAFAGLLLGGLAVWF
jgi:acetyltransferase